MSEHDQTTAASEAPAFALEFHQEDAYRFRVSFVGTELEDLVVDEPAPLGGSAGPNPTRMLATAVGHCLSSSLLFCLQKARVEGAQISTHVEGSLYRNERGRWRIAGLDVRLNVGDVADKDRARLERCLGLFEDFCVLTESVRGGLPVNLEVVTGSD